MSKEIEEAKAEIKFVEGDMDQLKTTLDDLKMKVAAALPDALSSWIDARFKQELELGPERFRAASESTINSVKGAVETLKKDLADAVVNLARPAKWPHSGGLHSGRGGGEALPSPVDEGVRAIMGKLADILFRYDLIAEGNYPGSCPWQGLRSPGQETRFVHSYDSLGGRDSMQGYWRELHRFEAKRRKLDEAKERLAKLEAAARWA